MDQVPNSLWIIVAIPLALIHWTARWRGWIRIGAATKPLVMVALILWSYSSTSGWDDVYRWVGAGLVFSLIGDVMLQLPRRFFIPGLFAFLLAHICYTTWFCLPFPIFHPILLALLFVIALGMYFYYHTLVKALRAKSHGRKFMIPVFLYGLTLCAMTISGCQTLLRADWPTDAAGFSALGGILFLISDSLLGFNRFVHPLPGGKTTEMVTYHLAQAAIIAGSLLR